MIIFDQNTLNSFGKNTVQFLSNFSQNLKTLRKLLGKFF